MAVSNRLPNRERITFNEENIERQYFTFPYPNMCYIRQNANGETQLKLRQTCKFFHKWSPKVIVGKLYVGYSSSTFAFKDVLYARNIDEMPVIDVVTDVINCESYDKRLLSKIRRCEAKIICLEDYDDITMEELRFYNQSGMVKEWYSSVPSFRGDNGNHLSLEDLLSHLPGADIVHARVQDMSRENSSKTVSKNNSIKELFLPFHGIMKVDKLYNLLRKVLAPNADVHLSFIDIEDRRYFSTYRAKLYAKMRTWQPKAEKPSFKISPRRSF